MKKRIICHLTIAVSIFILLAILPCCSKGNEIEIKLPAPVETSGMLFISGSVAMPGYYPLKDSDNLKSIIQAAGGTSPGADLAHLRLYVPAEGEAETPQKIDINRAEAWLLAALPGIGEVTAGRIVEYRDKNGLFRSVDDLARVEGIGPTTMNKIENLITISE